MHIPDIRRIPATPDISSGRSTTFSSADVPTGTPFSEKSRITSLHKTSGAGEVLYRSGKINQKVLMSGAEYFNDGLAINAYMDDQVEVNLSKALEEHAELERCFKIAGIEVVRVDAPKDCQDGVYTANWALVVGDKAIMANLPPPNRINEEPYALKVLEGLGKQVVRLPKELKFSGQGDALRCGERLFVGTTYRTSLEVHELLAQETGLEVISVQTIPQLDKEGSPVINSVSGWPDSYFYDLDLALAVVTPNLIAWCPGAFDEESQARIRNIDIEKIEVDFEEALRASACNLVSTGETIIMGNRAPKLQSALEERGFRVYPLEITELLKGGGFIRCMSLALD